MIKTIEGKLDKDLPLRWVSHYKLDGKWINNFIHNTLVQIRDGEKVRITIEVVT